MGAYMGGGGHTKATVVPGSGLCAGGSDLAGQVALGAACPPAKGTLFCGMSPHPISGEMFQTPQNAESRFWTSSPWAELRKEQAVAGRINNSSCFVIGKALAVTRAADGICCLVANCGPVASGTFG